MEVKAMTDVQLFSWIAIVLILSAISFFCGYKMGWIRGYLKAGKIVIAMDMNFWRLYNSIEKKG